MAIWNNLKKWLGMGVLAGSLALPISSRANEDGVGITNFEGLGNVGGGTFYISHFIGGEEAYDLGDVTWSWMNENLPNPNNKWLKVHTQPYSVELQTDGRPP